MPELDIVCPTGLSGTVRNVKGRELKQMSDRKKMRTGAALDDMLKGCWLQTGESSIYTFTDGQMNFDEVLVGDRYFILTRIRMASYPNEPYAFRVSCGEADCKAPINWEVMLEDLPVKMMSEESKKIFKAGNRYVTTVSHDGNEHRVYFRLQNGKDEKRNAKRSKQDSSDYISVLKTRLLSIDGVEDKRIDAFLEDLDIDQHRDLLESFDEWDCGIDTTFDVVCDDCGCTKEVELPLDKAFFMPPKRSKKDKANPSPVSSPS